MTEQEYEVPSLTQDFKNLFTRKGMRNLKLFFTDQEAYDKQHPYFKKMYCTECGHHEKHHKDQKYNDSKGYCRECWKNNDKLSPSGHEFNKKQSELQSAVSKILTGSSMIHEDEYRMYVYTSFISKEQLDNMESFLNLKTYRIEHLDGKSYYGGALYRIIFWTTSIFCKYCNRPFKTENEKREHEQKTDGWACYQRPPEVTFASLLE